MSEQADGGKGKDVSAEDLDNVRHMLGVSTKHPEGYRNYFVAGGRDIESMERLLAAGLVTKNARSRESAWPCYHATLEGAKAVGLEVLPISLTQHRERRR